MQLYLTRYRLSGKFDDGTKKPYSDCAYGKLYLEKETARQEVNEVIKSIEQIEGTEIIPVDLSSKLEKKLDT